jgi:hypothetical protein
MKLSSEANNVIILFGTKRSCFEHTKPFHCIVVIQVDGMPLHCKITKPDGLGTGTTISVVGKSKKGAMHINVFFKNLVGAYTFYMQLRWLPFENVRDNFSR